MKKLKILMLGALILGASTAMAFAAGDPFEDAATAVRWKDDAKATALIDGGSFDVNRQDGEGYTLLHLAADQNNLELAKLLLERGADPNIRSKLGSTVADMASSGSGLLALVVKAGGTYARNTPHAPTKAPAPAVGSRTAKPAPKGSATPAPQDARRKMCNARHYSSSALCSDTTCKMREYRKWQTCLKTGSYY